MSSGGHVPLIAVFASCIAAVFADASPMVMATPFTGVGTPAWAATEPLSGVSASQLGEQPHRSIVTVALPGFGSIQETRGTALSAKVEQARSGDDEVLATSAFVRTPGQSQHEDLSGHPAADRRATIGESPAPATPRGPLYSGEQVAPVQAPAIPEPESLFLLGTALLAAGFGARLIKRGADRRSARRRVPTSTP